MGTRPSAPRRPEGTPWYSPRDGCEASCTRRRARRALSWGPAATARQRSSSTETREPFVDRLPTRERAEPREPLLRDALHVDDVVPPVGIRRPRPKRSDVLAAISVADVDHHRATAVVVRDELRRRVDAVPEVRVEPGTEERDVDFLLRDELSVLPEKGPLGPKLAEHPVDIVWLERRLSTEHAALERL